MKTTLISAKLMHARLRPVLHRFVYPVFMLRLNLNEAYQEPEKLNSYLFGLNLRRPVSIYFKDFGPRDGSNLYVWAKALLAQHEIHDVAEINLQSFPRLFGYAFNPISVWYCYNHAAQLVATLAEVNNTFGEHHIYLLKNEDGLGIANQVELSAQKMMHVSPFCEIKGHYQFKFNERREKTSLIIDYHDQDGLLIQTALFGRKTEFSSRQLLYFFLRQPLLTFGVFFRIHWQALLLWKKRVPFFKQIHSHTHYSVGTSNVKK
ncbi:MAG: DUF1365 domain-containing protein [Undibacterium sp.]|nr:DUF1365 domain-containing protein [Undibacterium sp.]